MFLVQVRDQIDRRWCIVYVGEDEARARRLQAALLGAGLEPDCVALGEGALMREVHHVPSGGGGTTTGSASR